MPLCIFDTLDLLVERIYGEARRLVPDAVDEHKSIARTYTMVERVTAGTGINIHSFDNAGLVVDNEDFTVVVAGRIIA